MLDQEPQTLGTVFRGHMPDSTNLGPQGHGVVGPVSIVLSDDSVVIVGRYGGDQSARLRPVTVIGLLIGVAIGYALTRTTFLSESIWVTLGGAFVLAMFTFIGALLPMVLVKREVTRTGCIAELTIPLASIELMDSGSRIDSHGGTVEHELSRPLAVWLMTSLSNRHEVLLTAPTTTRGRQVLRIVMPDVANANGLREELQRRKSMAS